VSLSEESLSNTLSGYEFYLFTGNAVAEAAFFKGTSSNQRLFDLVVRLKKLELAHGFTLHVIHVAGQRMQDQGTDGLSHGDLLSGVMTGSSMLEFVPLHLSATDRTPQLVSWVQSWVPLTHTVFLLQPINWFVSGHGLAGWEANLDGLSSPVAAVAHTTIFLWSPPPAAAVVAVEQLSYSRIMRPHLIHVFVVPRLMTAQWRKQLFKLADLVFTLPVAFNPAVWDACMSEPLVVGIVLPYLPVPPWSRRDTPSVLKVGRALSGLFASLSGHECPILRQLWDGEGG
jgi:hypothetical protein